MKESGMEAANQAVKTGSIVAYRAQEGHTDLIFLPSASSWQEYMLAGTILLGWLLPLVAGMRLRRRGRKTGRILVWLGAVWGVLALAFVGWGVWMLLTCGFMPKRFNPATYRGAVGTVVFPYGGKGDVIFGHSESNSVLAKTTLWKAAVTNGIATLPAGRIAGMTASFPVTNASGNVAGQLTWINTATYGELALESGGRHEFAGGFPLTASMRVEKGRGGDGQYDVMFWVSDRAGNFVSLYGRNGNLPNVAFEATTPDGTCFWRGRLGDDGSHRVKIPDDAPSTFTIRPVLGKVPFDIRVEETQVSRDALMRETPKREGNLLAR